jgi:hypothetical protein
VPRPSSLGRTLPRLSAFEFPTLTSKSTTLGWATRPPIDKADKGYADYNAPDWSADHASHIPLSDFFGSTAYNFTNINTSQPYTCFQNFGTCTNTPYVSDGPDSDDGD